MSDKPKRRWFQIHLSTAIILSFVAGGGIWANTRATVQKEYTCPGFREYTYRDFNGECHTAREAVSDGLLHNYSRFGFPMVALTTDATDSSRDWNPKNLAVNIITLLAVLVFIAAQCEYLIRRRKPTA